MTRKAFQTAEEIFKQNNGILRTGKAKKLGIHEVTLVQMCGDGLLVKESRGILSSG